MTTEQRTTILGRKHNASRADQLADPVVLTRLATLALSLYLAVMLGFNIVTLAVVVVVAAVGAQVSTEFGQRETLVERVLAKRRARQ
ncbi:hypothetical protein AYK61_25995 [Rhodococcus sp. SBT000017]|jgi:hypothetical protein|uniref:hypothetical protein n=1 Tax=Rhodococcus sp. SBT000017 TaxID=1803385 RepID=UPI000EF89F42|nr:hypothetical protein [Rhodococcus sp. SBT000017]RMB70190.1 hypothetical protein AYK61_25995 [Rhodococcus sp. SBT000017]